jgi:hypothetical protein
METYQPVLIPCEFKELFKQLKLAPLPSLKDGWERRKKFDPNKAYSEGVTATVSREELKSAFDEAIVGLSNYTLNKLGDGLPQDDNTIL